MITKRYNELFNKFEALKEADAKYKASLHNIAQVKQELKDIKNLGKFSSKESNILFDNIKLNFNQINLELNHLRDAILTDQIFDSSEVETSINKFEDIFNISQSLNIIKNVLDKKNIITDILYFELTQSTPPFSKIFKTELNNLLNEKKTTKGVNRDLINFKNTLDKYTEFDQKTFDEIKNKNGVDISVLLSNKKYIANILSTKQIDNVENYIKLIFTEINSFNEAFTDLLEKYQKHISSSANQINKKIKENLEYKTLKNEIILKDIETILNANKKAYEEALDKKEAEEERLRQDKEKQLISQKNAKRAAEQAAEQARLKAIEKKQFREGLYYLIGFIVAIAGIILVIWGVWELCVYIWSSYAKIVVGTITAILVIISGTVFFAGSKILGVIFFIGTAYIYGFLDDLVPQAVINENKKIEVVKKLNNKSIKPSQVKICPSSGYKDNCRGIMTYKVGTYEGFFKNNKRHGQGTFTWKYGDKYVGQWKDDKENGQGSYYFKDGRKYVGQWKNGIKHGQGTFTWNDGDKYTGQWQKDQRHGQGNYYYNNGDKYSGQWQKGLEHGQGTKTTKNGNIEKGIWKKGFFISSKPKTSSLNEQFKAKDSIKSSQVKICPSPGYKDNCKGKMTYNSGNTYNGFFKNNKRHGKGTYTWTNGNKYVGQWENNKENGQGIKTYKNGKIENGIWENGKFLYAESSANP